MSEPARRSLRVGLTQLSPTLDVATNVEQAVDMVLALGPAKPDLVLLPENCLAIGTNAQMRASALAQDSPEIDALRDAALRAATTVVLGGFKRVAPDGRIYNTALVIDARGTVVGHYDKVHLFDANLGGTSYQASSVESPGTHPVMIVVNGVRIGLTICFDVRFPELHRRLAAAGAEVILVPAAFVTATGVAHWEVLNRARAIENGAYVVASATVGLAADTTFPTYGHALAVDPWGRVLADLGAQKSGSRVIDLDLTLVEEARRSLPVLKAVRPDAYVAEVEEIDVGTSTGSEMRSA